MFKGKLDGPSFTNLLGGLLLPFIDNHMPNYHELHMDNAPSHSAHVTGRFIIENRINSVKAAPQSPDFNPIELVWNDQKEYLAAEVKPTTKEGLIAGIREFWETKVTIEYCCSKINHLPKVLREAVRLNGKATGM